MPGYRNDGGSAIVQAISSYNNQRMYLDDRNYKRGQNELDRQERRANTAFNQGIATRRDAREQTTFDNKIQYDKDTKDARRSVVEQGFSQSVDPSTLVETDLSASAAQQVRAPNSPNQLEGNVKLSPNEDGTVTPTVQTSNGVLLPHTNADGEAIRVSAKDMSFVEQVMAMGQGVPGVGKEAVANALLASNPDGSTRVASEDEFIEAVNNPVQQGPQESVVRGRLQSNYPRTINAVEEGMETAKGFVSDSVDAVKQAADGVELPTKDEFLRTEHFEPGGGGAAGAIAEAATEVGGKLIDWSNVSAFKRLTHELKPVTDFLFGTKAPAMEPKVTGKGDNAVVEANAVPSKINPKKDTEALTRMAKINSTATIAPEKIQEAEYKTTQAKGNKRLAASLADLYVLTGDAKDLTRAQNAYDTGNPDISAADWKKMGQDDRKLANDARKTEAMIRKYDNESMLAQAKLKGLGKVSAAKQAEADAKTNKAFNARLGQLGNEVADAMGFTKEHNKRIAADTTQAARRAAVAMNIPVEKMGELAMDVWFTEGMKSYVKGKESGNYKGSSATPFMNTASHDWQRQAVADSIQEIHKNQPKEGANTSEWAITESFNAMHDTAKRALGGPLNEAQFELLNENHRQTWANRFGSSQ